jgi:hypothetical protein
MRRFIVEMQLGQWTAWELSHPDVAYSGEAPSAAIRKLFEALGLDCSKIIVKPNQRPNRLEFAIRDEPCPDCKGTGRYVGLNAVEKCATCGGAGRR